MGITLGMGLSKIKDKLAKIALTSTALIAVLNLTPAFALTNTDIVSAGSIWLESTIAVAMVFVTAMAFSLQISRGYFLRILDKFTLRLGADIWWLAYVLIRDGLIFISFVMSLMVFFPGTFLDYPMAVPFMPLTAVLFGAALVTKLYFDADDNRNVFRFVTVLVFLGAVSWIFGTVFITETPLALSPLPAGVSATGGFWGTIYNTFSSTQNMDLAMASFYAGFAALSGIALIGFAHPLLHSRIKARKLAGAQTTVAPPAIPVSVPTGRATPSTQASASPTRERADYA